MEYNELASKQSNQNYTMVFDNLTPSASTKPNFNRNFINLAKSQNEINTKIQLKRSQSIKEKITDKTAKFFGISNDFSTNVLLGNTNNEEERKWQQRRFRHLWQYGVKADAVAEELQPIFDTYSGYLTAHDEGRVRSKTLEHPLSIANYIEGGIGIQRSRSVNANGPRVLRLRLPNSGLTFQRRESVAKMAIDTLNSILHGQAFLKTRHRRYVENSNFLANDCKVRDALLRQENANLNNPILTSNSFFGFPAPNESIACENLVHNHSHNTFYKPIRNRNTLTGVSSFPSFKHYVISEKIYKTDETPNNNLRLVVNSLESNDDLKNQLLADSEEETTDYNQVIENGNKPLLKLEKKIEIKTLRSKSFNVKTYKHHGNGASSLNLHYLHSPSSKTSLKYSKFSKSDNFKQYDLKKNFISSPSITNDDLFFDILPNYQPSTLTFNSTTIQSSKPSFTLYEIKNKDKEENKLIITNSNDLTISNTTLKTVDFPDIINNETSTFITYKNSDKCNFTLSTDAQNKTLNSNSYNNSLKVSYISDIEQVEFYDDTNQINKKFQNKLKNVFFASNIIRKFLLRLFWLQDFSIKDIKNKKIKNSLQYKVEQKKSDYTLNSKKVLKKRSLPIYGKFKHHQKIDPKFARHFQNEFCDYRPFFTYWITTLQIVIMFFMLHQYGIGSSFSNGIGVIERSGDVTATFLSIIHIVVWEQNNVWIGPRFADLVHAGAKYTPCMRHDESIYKQIYNERNLEAKETGCCIGTEGCYQSSECPKQFARLVKWSNMSKNNLNFVENNQDVVSSIRIVCGQDPRYCDEPRSKSPFEWNNSDISKWPKCQRTIPIEMIPKHEEHMHCDVTGRPCCIQMHGQCRITTSHYCKFVGGYWHENATLCSQVSCMNSVCGMTPFVYSDYPDQIYRLITPLFLHAGVIRCLITVVLQMTFMRSFEKMIGWLRLSIIYFVSGIGGYLASSVFVPYMPEVGPAGSQGGILGALTVTAFYNRHFLAHGKKVLLIHLAIAAVMFGTGFLPFVDNWAQFFGFIFGCLLAAALIPYITFGKRKTRQKRLLIVLFSLGTAMLLFIILFTLFYAFPATIINNDVLSLLNCPFSDKVCDHQSLRLRSWLPI